MKFKILLALFAASAAFSPLVAASYYTEQPKDAQAVLVTPENFAIHGDGISDDSNAIQQAINKVQEAHNEGVVLLPSGRYRISKTI